MNLSKSCISRKEQMMLQKQLIDTHSGIPVTRKEQMMLQKQRIDTHSGIPVNDQVEMIYFQWLSLYESGKHFFWLLNESHFPFKTNFL